MRRAARHDAGLSRLLSVLILREGSDEYAVYERERFCNLLAERHFLLLLCRLIEDAWELIEIGVPPERCPVVQCLGNPRTFRKLNTETPTGTVMRFLGERAAFSASRVTVSVHTIGDSETFGSSIVRALITTRALALISKGKIAEVRFCAASLPGSSLYDERKR